MRRTRIKHHRSVSCEVRAVWFAALISATILVPDFKAFSQDEDAGAAPDPAAVDGAGEPSIGIEKPLIEPAEVSAWKKTRIDFQAALGEQQLSADTQKKISEGFRVLLFQLSLPEHRNELTGLRKAIIRYVEQFGSSPNIRRFACGEIVKHATQLLDGNFHVRLQVVLLVGELNIVPEKPGFEIAPAVAYFDGSSFLVDVISPQGNATKQPEAARVLAAYGLERLLRRGRSTLSVTDKRPQQIAQRLLPEFSKPWSDWYLARLATALVQTGQATIPTANNGPQPSIVETLARLVADKNRGSYLRSRAAFALGRTPVPQGIKPDPIAWALVDLAAQLSNELNQGKIKPVQALYRFQDLYLAFRPIRKGEPVTGGANQQAGLTNSLNQPSIRNAYQDVLPAVKTIFYQIQNDNVTGIAPQVIQKLLQWKKPADLKLTPKGAAVDQPLGGVRKAGTAPNAPQAANAQPVRAGAG